MRVRQSTVGAGAGARRMRIDSRRRWFPDLAEFMRYRHLVVLLGRRDVTVRYRQTLLGSLWVFAGPIVSAGLFSFVFGRIAGLPSQGSSYFVFSYAGLLAWNLFSGALTASSTSLTTNSGLVTKIYFPRLVLPVSTLATPALNTLISFGVMLVLLFISGTELTLQVLTLPIWLGLGILLASGIAFILTSVSVSYRDVNYVTPLLTQLMLYLSPVAYSVEAVPESLRTGYLLNPLATIVEGCRWAVLGGSYLPPSWAIAYSSALTLSVFVVGLVVFARREPGFADVI